MTIQISSLFALLLLLASPLTASAQWVCSASHVSTVEYVPEVRTGIPGAMTIEALDRHVPEADRPALTAQILELAHRLRIYCAHHLRVSFNYLYGIGYGVHIDVRGPADRCWEQVQCGVVIYREDPGSEGHGIDARGDTPAAAVNDAVASATVVCTDVLISCPGDPPLH